VDPAWSLEGMSRPTPPTCRTRNWATCRAVAVICCAEQFENDSSPVSTIVKGVKRAMAHQAMAIEPRVGAMLPCNVILREIEGGVEVSAIDPVASMQAIDNHTLKAVAGQVRNLLAKPVAEI
jgi:hypothetical protein